MAAPDPRPLVLHLIHRFDTGGLENGLVNLLNRLPEGEFRHAVMALTEVAPAFRQRVRRRDVEFIALNKAPGQGLWLYPRFGRELRRLKPGVLHTRNLGTLEFQLPAAALRVPFRIHGEHGRDIDDLDGSSRRHRGLRKLYAPFVHRYVALSQELFGYLTGAIGIAPARIEQIYNGVDTDRFTPRAPGESTAAAGAAIPGWPFGGAAGSDEAPIVIGTVGRLQPVKAQTLLAEAFVRALARAPTLRQRLRLVIVGDGPLRPQVQQILSDGGAADRSWLAGERSDVPALLRALDVFVLPSLAEGVSNTLLEAMACALPVVATRVGANAELAFDGQHGRLVPSQDVDAMAGALIDMAHDADRRRGIGEAGRARILEGFSLEAMAAAYAALYRGAP